MAGALGHPGDAQDTLAMPWARLSPAPLPTWLTVRPVLQPDRKCQFPLSSPGSVLCQAVLWELISPPSASIRDLSQHGLGRDVSSHPRKEEMLSS